MIEMGPIDVAVWRLDSVSSMHVQYIELFDLTATCQSFIM